MNKARQLAQHSAALITQIAIQRKDMAQQVAALQPAAHLIDKVRDGLVYLRHYREALLLPLALILVSRPRRIITFFLSSVGVWRLIQNWRRSIRG